MGRKLLSYGLSSLVAGTPLLAHAKPILETDDISNSFFIIGEEAASTDNLAVIDMGPVTLFPPPALPFYTAPPENVSKESGVYVLTVCGSPYISPQKARESLDYSIIAHLEDFYAQSFGNGPSFNITLNTSPIERPAEYETIFGETVYCTTSSVPEEDVVAIPRSLPYSGYND